MKLAVSDRPCMESAANCSPAIQPSVRGFERGDVRCREVEAHHLVEKIGGFIGRKAQVGGAQFGQLAAGAQAGQRERRILSAGNDQPELRRQMIDKEGQRLVDRRGLDHVIIVEDEHRIAQRGEIVQQRRQQHIGWRRLRPTCSAPNVASPTVGAMVCKAAMKYARKRGRSLSSLSSDSHATLERWMPYPTAMQGCSASAILHLAEIHSLTSVVLPKPAGAEMRMTLGARCRPACKRSIKRAR